MNTVVCDSSVAPVPPPQGDPEAKPPKSGASGHLRAYPHEKVAMPLSPPPYQLVKGDAFNASIGLIAAFLLASAKDVPGLHPFVSWSLSAYTNWNLSFIALRLALSQEQWDPFLLCNSMGVLMGFRTAMSQGIANNMRRKIELLGLSLTRWQFDLADHLCHTLPAVVLLRSLVRRRQRVHLINAIYGLTLASWFSFRQQAKLDSSGIYVPHPWRRTWLAIATGMLTMPPLVDALIAKRKQRSLVIAAVLLLPWLSAYLDPTLKKKYDFEYALSKLEARNARAKLLGRTQSPNSMRRVASAAPFSSNQQGAQT